jgi:acetamidase/formamidase
LTLKRIGRRAADGRAGQSPHVLTVGAAASAPRRILLARPGGNVDCKELVEGSTLLLPVPVPGALSRPALD